MRIDLVSCCIRGGLLLALAAAPLPSPGAGPVDFAHEVTPILRQHCAECHVGDRKKGGFSLNTRESMLAGGESGPAVVPGKPGQSPLIGRVMAQGEDRMPPKGDGLSAAQAQVLERWIGQGAAWAEGFAFQKPAFEPPLRPRTPDLPPPRDGRSHPIDRLIDAALVRGGVSVPAGLGDAAFCRRVHLDLVGLLPEPEALREFLAGTASDKRTQLVQRLLGNQTAYAEHWLAFWNDLLRNDYTGTGYIDGGRKPITAWLYQALLDNKPYDQMARELIAPGPQSEGFARGIQWRGTVSAGQSVPVQFAQSVGQVFLGINLKCASCHDSFVDHWKLDQAYGLAAIYADKPLEIYRCDKPTGRSASPAWLFPELGQVDPAKPRAERLRELAGLMTHPENGRFARTAVNRLWQRLMGRGIVHPTDAMESEPWNADLLDFLASDFAGHGYDLKRTLELICTSQAYQAGAQVLAPGAEAPFIYSGPRARRLTAEQFVDAVWQLTGAAPARPQAAVPGVRSQTNAPQPMVRASLMHNDLLMRALGRPNREQIVSMRPNDLTTLEAMDLSNGAILADYLGAGSCRLLEKGWGSPAALVDWLYTFALARPPTPAEADLARELLGPNPAPEPVADLLWALVLLPEFQLIR